MRSRGRHRAWALAALLGPLAGSAAVAAPRLGGSFAFVSDDVLQGLSRTCGDPAAQLDVHASGTGGRSPTEWFAGAWGSVGLGHDPCGRAREVNAYAGVSVGLTRNQRAELSWLRYFNPGGSDALYDGHRYDFDALQLGWLYQDRLRVTLSFTPDATGYANGHIRQNRTAGSASVQLQQPLTGGLRLTAGAGYDTVTDLGGTGYGYWSVGAAWARGRLQLTLDYDRASPRTVRIYYPSVAGARVVGTVLWSFVPGP